MKRLALILVLLSVPCFGAYTISAVRVINSSADTNSACNQTVTYQGIAGYSSCNGFVAEIDLQGASTNLTFASGMTNYSALSGFNDPTGANMVFTITAPGYSAGVLTTVTATAYGCIQLRQPYPNQANHDETNNTTYITARIALCGVPTGMVYSADTATATIAAGTLCNGATCNAAFSGAVTNQSTVPYSLTKSIGAWENPTQYDRVTGNFTLEFLPFNYFAQNGRTVDSVVMKCSDAHSNTAGPYTISTMTTSAQTGDQQPVPVYAATVDVSTLTQADPLTCNALVYPFRGDVTAVLDSNTGNTQPGPKLADLTLLNDKSGTYGGGVAVVDSVNGNASIATTWVAANQAAAEAAYVSSTANSYVSACDAATAIKSYNNANLSRNEPGGGIVLVTGTTNDLGLGTCTLGAGTQRTWLTVTHLSTQTTAQAGFSNNNTNQTIAAKLLRFQGITFAGTYSAHFWISGGGAGYALSLDQDVIDETGNGIVGGFAAVYATRNTVLSTHANGFGGANNTSTFAKIRGNSFPYSFNGAYMAADEYNSVGNLGIYFKQRTDANQPDPIIVAFNKILGVGNGPVGFAGGNTLTNGIAIVQNVVEGTGSATQPAFQVCAGQGASGSTSCNNVMVWYNDSTNMRWNFLYNWSSAGSPLVAPFMETNNSFRGNMMDWWADKTDVTTSTQSSFGTGNWSVIFGVAHSSNLKTTSAGVDDTFVGLYTYGYNGSPNLGYVNCQARADIAGNGCNGNGNGDYHLASAALMKTAIPAGMQMLPIDINGVARNNTTGGAAGAYEYPSNTSQGNLQCTIQGTASVGGTAVIK